DEPADASGGKRREAVAGRQGPTGQPDVAHLDAQSGVSGSTGDGHEGDRQGPGGSVQGSLQAVADAPRSRDVRWGHRADGAVLMHPYAFSKRGKKRKKGKRK